MSFSAEREGVSFRHLSLLLAESEGFEPPDQLPGHRISSAARSTTPATFLLAHVCFRLVVMKEAVLAASFI